MRLAAAVAALGALSGDPEGEGGALLVVIQLAVRLNAASKLGFRRALIPKTGRRSGDPLPDTIETIAVRALEEALDAALR